MHYRREGIGLCIYFARVSSKCAESYIAPGRSRGAASAAAWSLLLWALRREYGVIELPDVTTDERGKPYFPARPDIRFSLSHTRGYVLCALGNVSVGADVQLISEKDAPFTLRLMDEREARDFTLHELWCLRESVFKLTGRGELRSMRFRREGGVIVPPEPGVVCALYTDVPGCAAAAAVYASETLPERLMPVPEAELQKGVVI